MAQKIPSKVSLYQAIYLCLLAIFKPARLIELENEDSTRLNEAENDKAHRAMKVHYAFKTSFLLIAGFSILGVILGFVLKCLFGTPQQITVSILQITGAGLLLWGTLFVRGFEIQSFSCVTLSERVNQWLYRALCCAGTTFIISSLAW